MILRVRFLLVHSPAVGPSTWEWVAGSLRSQGHEVLVPNLIAAAEGVIPASSRRMPLRRHSLPSAFARPVGYLVC
jgi:hypothetical protein